MERYFTVVKRSASEMHSQKNQGDATANQPSNCTPCEAPVKLQRITGRPLVRFKSSASNVLLSTLGDEINPITHSDLAGRSDQVFSASSGHQVAEDRKRYCHERQSALSTQRKTNNRGGAGSGIFRGTRIYINGYLEGTTDIEIKQLVAEGGGEILFTPSQSTHILTSQGLSASKTQAYLKTTRSSKPHIVKPGWILDSMASGRRRPEKQYTLKMDLQQQIL